MNRNSVNRRMINQRAPRSISRLRFRPSRTFRAEENDRGTLVLHVSEASSLGLTQHSQPIVTSPPNHPSVAVSRETVFSTSEYRAYPRSSHEISVIKSRSRSESVSRARFFQPQDFSRKSIKSMLGKISVSRLRQTIDASRFPSDSNHDSIRQTVAPTITTSTTTPGTVTTAPTTTSAPTATTACSDSSNIYTENAWRRIAKEMNQPDEMSFLLPFMQERDTCSNLEDVSDDNNEDRPNEDEYHDTNNESEDDRNDDRRDDRNDDRKDDRNDDKDDDKDDNVDKELHAENEKKKKQKEINRKIITKAKNKENKCQTQPETGSAVMIKYLLEKKTAKAQITPPTQQSDANAIDTFFSSIAATVKSFCPYYQNVAKSQIFSIISDLEIKQILQEQPPNAPIQRQHSVELYHTRPYNVSRPLSSISLSPSSPSMSTIPASPSSLRAPTPSPSYYDMSIPMPHLSEQTDYTQKMSPRANKKSDKTVQTLIIGTLWQRENNGSLPALVFVVPGSKNSTRGATLVLLVNLVSLTVWPGKPFH
ncbi:hypothetical protein DBV15_05003 [Temnothorax longispinosus]|uniref:Uncharacterized protein n=1 Tax=Temnothorax longispinosus TaxID=300112 RepID=A0A4S2KNI6_9HYME|nr:hypothetical protein DBV15_05003 [Temnothorax longispinosus]